MRCGSWPKTNLKLIHTHKHTRTPARTHTHFDELCQQAESSCQIGNLIKIPQSRNQLRLKGEAGQQLHYEHHYHYDDVASVAM